MTSGNAIRNAYAQLQGGDLSSTEFVQAMHELYDSGALVAIRANGTPNTDLEEARWLYGLLSQRAAMLNQFAEVRKQKH